MSLKNYKSDLKKANEKGAPLRLEPNADGSVPVVYVLRTWHVDTKYQRLYREGLEKYEKDEYKASAHALCEYITGWENLRYEDDGEDLPFSKEAVFELMSDERYRDFRDLVEAFSSTAAKYRETELKETIKN